MSLQPEALTWTGLLAQWVNFAQASMALPDEPHGSRWRASVPAIINLQAVTFALPDLDQLDADERALGLDRAEILIRDNAHLLDKLWADPGQSIALQEIISDAWSALRMRRDLQQAASGTDQTPPG